MDQTIFLGYFFDGYWFEGCGCHSGGKERLRAPMRGHEIMKGEPKLAVGARLR